MPEKIGNVLSWATDIDAGVIEQAAKASRLPFLAGHLALMPDAHVGSGATIGSVIPTRGAIIPAAVGVDIGCGMVAVETDLSAPYLPDDLSHLRDDIAAAIPSGVGKGHSFKDDWDRSRRARRIPPYFGSSTLTGKQVNKITEQFGTLGSGNHFVEISLDEQEQVWVVLHSGSRGIGNQLAMAHIATAKGLMRQRSIRLEDPDLAYLTEGEPEFQAYIADMLWAQDYARANRDAMMDTTLAALWRAVGVGRELHRINCHHNYTESENHYGQNVWLTRKGAIRARRGDMGVIPGSMGTGTYIVSGLGNPASYDSCSHGAGRRLSRSAARKTLTADSLVAQMGTRSWDVDKAEQLLDEHPDAYKDIENVMANQADLVKIEHRLEQVLNHKGT